MIERIKSIISETVGHNWCSECSRNRFGDECRECESKLQKPPTRVILKRALVASIVFTISVIWLFGPPVLAVLRLLQGGPLYYTEEVTKTATVTVYHGVLPDLALLVPWFLTIIIFWILASGLVPRRF